MATPFGRIGFAAGVLGVVALLAVLIAGRELLSGESGASSPGGPPPAAAGKAGGGRGGPPGMPATPVVTAAAATHTFSDAIQAIGTAQARESVTITSSVTDTIRALQFDSGDRVRRGQVLVELTAAEESAQLAEAEASLAESQRELERFTELHERGFSPLARLQQAQAGFEQAQARVQSARARLSDRVIRAPFSGVIGLRQVSPGALVRPGDAIATLDDLSQVKIDFDVSETELAALRPGVAIAALAGGTTVTGTIDTVDSRVSPATRTVRVRAILPNQDQRLRTGMTVTVTIRSNPRDALAVPEIAIMDRPAGPQVLRVIEGEGGPTVEAVPVRIGRRSEGMAEVLDGLAEGDAVIVEGLNRARPGQTVRLQEPPEERAEAARQP
jgi:membrane fusion protein (multidrug efflux system)